MSLLRNSFIVLLISSILWYLTQIYPNAGLHDDEHHEYFVLKDIWSEEAASRLLSFVENHGYFTTVAEDNTAKVEEIGESTSPVDGACAHKYHVLNRNKTKCILPSRLDVGKHQLMTGGISARKEKYEDLVTRMLPFGGYFFDKLKENADLRLLFDSPRYQQESAKVCEGRTVMDPIQLSILINLPGQETPMHLDVPWFFSAHRFNLPQWLLVVMENSNLWNHVRVPQVQGVAYIHRWNDSDYTQRGGDFFFYPKGTGGPILSIPPQWNTGIVLDGSRCVHGVTPYQSLQKPPTMEKEGKNELKFEEGKWVLYTRGNPVAQYQTHDLRIAFVWRDRCFRSEEEKKQWHEAADMPLEEALSTLEKDLRKRGKLSGARPPPMDFALLLIQEYARLPYPPSWFPFNYCMVSKEPSLKFLQPLVDLVC